MINNIKDGSGSRLKEFRKALSLTQIEFAKKLNVSNGHVSDLEKDRKNITESLLKLLNYEFKLNINWLITGKGEMFQETDDLFELFGYMINEMDENEKKFMKNFLALPKKERQMAISFLSKLTKE